MESRQASSLSKDVRLLTYVTIFFLPLAFSTVGVSLSQLHCLVATQANPFVVSVEYQRDISTAHPRLARRYYCRHYLSCDFES